MKCRFIKQSGIVLFMVMSVISCGDGLFTDSCTIIQAEYTGKNTARVIYQTRKYEGISLYAGSVYLYNKDFIKTYQIRKESSHEVWRNILGNFKYYVDITVEPDWEPGDHVWVDGNGYFQGITKFDVPEK